MKKSINGNNQAGFPSFYLRDDDHTPWDCHKGEKKAVAMTQVTYYDGSRNNPDPWLEIRQTEVVTHSSGRVTERVISTTLNAEEIFKLREIFEMGVAEPYFNAEIGI